MKNLESYKTWGGVRFKSEEDVFLSLDDNKLHYGLGEYVPFGHFLYSNGKVGTGITDDIVGLCVVPSTHTDDGMGRFMCLTDTDTDGGMLTGNERTTIAWGPSGTTVLTGLDYYQTYQAISRCESGNSCSTQGTYGYGFLPSDIFTSGTVVTGDCIPKDVELRMFGTDSKYDIYRCPYPYLADWSKNPDYSSGEVDTKFLDGWRLTRVLTGLGNEYEAAKACVDYSKNTPGFETYLPTIGELGYMMARLGRVNEILGTLGNKAQPITIVNLGYYWSSSESHSFNAHTLYTNDSNLFHNGKFGKYYVRPFLRKDNAFSFSPKLFMFQRKI